MLPLALWFVAPIINAVVVCRLLHDRRLRFRYRLFALCTAVSMTITVFLLVLYRFFPLLTYAKAYYPLQMLTECFTCASLAEVCQRAFVEHGMTRTFGKICQGLLASVAAVLAVGALIEKNTPTIQPLMLLLRNMVTLETILAALIVAGILYFGVPLNRNLKGLVLGWGVTIGGELVAYSVSAALPRSNVLDILVDAITLFHALAAAVIWLVSFWNYHPDPVIDVEAMRAILLDPLPKRLHRLGHALLAYLIGAFRPRRPSAALKADSSGD